MSIQPPSQDTEGYCTPQDIVDFFEKYDAFLDHGEVLTTSGDVEQEADVSESEIEEIGPTDPTKTHVERRIGAASNWIDNYTGHAWRPRQMKGEMITLGSTYYWQAGTPMKLVHRDIVTPLDPAEGDELKIWDGSEYENWLEDDDMTEGRDGDYWVNEAEGMLYIYRRRLWFRRHKEIEVSYRFGKDVVPPTVRDVCARRTAAHYLQAQQYRVTTPGNEETPDPQQVAEDWKDQCKTELKEFKEVRSVGHH